MISANIALTPSVEVVVTPLADGEGVLLDVAAGRYIRLNKTAMIIWTAIEKGEDIEAIKRAITERFDITEQQARDTLNAFISQLIADKLITDPTEG